MIIEPATAGPTRQPESPQLDIVPTIAEALQAKFGADAIVVAQTQHRVATDETRTVWAQVVARFESQADIAIDRLG